MTCPSGPVEDLHAPGPPCPGIIEALERERSDPEQARCVTVATALGPIVQCGEIRPDDAEPPVRVGRFQFLAIHTGATFATARSRRNHAAVNAGGAGGSGFRGEVRRDYRVSIRARTLGAMAGGPGSSAAVNLAGQQQTH